MASVAYTSIQVQINSQSVITGWCVFLHRVKVPLLPKKYELTELNWNN